MGKGKRKVALKEKMPEKTVNSPVALAPWLDELDQ
jgi:hypothetical protein